MTTQPSNQAIAVSGSTSFTAIAGGNPAPGVQWYVSTSNGKSFTPLSNGGVYSGVTTRTLTITGATAAMNGYEYEAVFTNSVGTATTSVATLTVGTLPAVTKQPANQTINAGGKTSFSAAATGSPTPSVQWYVSTNGGTSFAPLVNGGVYSGVTTGTLTISGATAAMNGCEYEAVFTNSIGTAKTSVAALTVHFAPSVTTQPGNQSVNAGGKISFSAVASGSPATTVKWEVSTNGGKSFTALSNGGVYSGVTTGTLTITGATAAMNGYEYKAIFTNSLGTATTSVAKLTVVVAPTVTTQPTSKSVKPGGSTNFTAAASGTAPSVQWYVSTNGGATFTALSNGGVYSGATTGALTITDATTAMNGYEYRAVFTNSDGTATTETATLTVT